MVNILFNIKKSMHNSLSVDTKAKHWGRCTTWKISTDDLRLAIFSYVQQFFGHFLDSRNSWFKECFFSFLLYLPSNKPLRNYNMIKDKDNRSEISLVGTFTIMCDVAKDRTDYILNFICMWIVYILTVTAVVIIQAFKYSLFQYIPFKFSAAMMIQ